MIGHEMAILLLRQTVKPALNLLEPLALLDELLVHNILELRTGAAIAGRLHGRHNIPDAHRLAVLRQSGLDVIRKRLVVPRPSPAAAACAAVATRAAGDLVDLRIQLIDDALRLVALARQLIDLPAAVVEDSLEVGERQVRTRRRTCHSSFSSFPPGPR